MERGQGNGLLDAIPALRKCSRHSLPSSNRSRAMRIQDFRFPTLDTAAAIVDGGEGMPLQTGFSMDRRDVPVMPCVEYAVLVDSRTKSDTSLLPSESLMS